METLIYLYGLFRVLTSPGKPEKQQMSWNFIISGNVLEKYCL